MAIDTSNQLFTQPKFPSKPVLPSNTSSFNSNPKSNPTLGIPESVGSKMQLVGIGMLVVGLILLAIGIMNWK